MCVCVEEGSIDTGVRMDKLTPLDIRLRKVIFIDPTIELEVIIMLILCIKF